MEVPNLLDALNVRYLHDLQNHVEELRQQLVPTAGKCKQILTSSDTSYGTAAPGQAEQPHPQRPYSMVEHQTQEIVVKT
jgi:hypothetical protein